VHDGWLIVDSYKNGLYNEFMLFYFENFRSKIINMGSGSIFKNLKTEYIKDLNIAIPPIHLLEKSKVAFDNIYKQVLTNAIQNQQLTELRDWLLPMLMNGQVTVKEAEESLSMAAEPSVEYKKG
jgi:type I restriction enzyme S subunit